MASEIKSDKLSPSGGTALQIGDASDTITIPTGATFTIVDGLPVASGGTGLASFTAGDILYATGSTTLAKLGKGTARQGLQTNSGATAPEWAASPQSVLTAEGDIIYASGANTLAKLAKGSDDEVLTLASGVPSWAEAAGGGKVLQVVSATKTDTFSADSTSAYVDITGITVSITPAATTSKILIFGTTYVANTGGDITTQIVRDSTPIAIGDADGNRRVATTAGSPRSLYELQSQPFNYLDSPSTDSSTTYKIQGQGNFYVNRTEEDADTTTAERTVSTITVMEIGA